MPATKYRNTPVEVDGHRFPSKKEANVYIGLKLLERSKKISGLTLQPRYPLVVNGHKVCTYVADFMFFEAGKCVAADAKGYKTQVYQIKSKLFRALYPDIELREF